MNLKMEGLFGYILFYVPRIRAYIRDLESKQARDNSNCQVDSAAG
jgi:hypothetical protein